MRQTLSIQSLTRFGLALTLAAVAGAVYRSNVPSKFVPVRVVVVGAEQLSAERAIKIALPDVSALRGHTAVLGVRLRNTGSAPRSVALSLHGLPKHRVDVPAHGAIRWDIVLSPGIVRALTGDAGDVRARFLELTSDAGGWAVTALEVRNYHARLGERVMVIVLPGRADVQPAGTGLVPVTIVLTLLAVMTTLGPTPRGRLLQRLGAAVTLTAFLTFVVCLIFPWISPYKLVLSPSAFTLIGGGLFAPIFLYAARPVGAWTRSRLRRSASTVGAAIRTTPRRFATVTRYWAAHALTLERGAALLALVAIGVAQPVFEVLSNSPEFFAARSTTPPIAIAAVLAICLGVPLALLGIERAIRAASPRAAAGFHGVVVALLAAAVVMPWFRRSEVLASPWDATISALFGFAVAVAYARMGLVRQFLTALAPAALAVPAVFLLDPAVARTFLPSESPAGVQTIERTPPIVLVIFDELPLNSLLDAQRMIDAERYPNFAKLARDGYWFRNASTVSSDTVWAVPAILSGRYPTTRRAVPTLRYYPVNLFTTLAPHYDIFATLRFQQLCPPRACQYNSAIPADTVWSLLSDLTLVWLHIVLPQPLTEGLPAVVGDWAEFARPRAVRTGEGPTGRAGIFAQFLSAIDGQPARMHVIHSLLPHMLFQYVPSGRQYSAPDYQTTIERGKPLFERVSAAYADTLHQRHLAQVGYVDRLIGDLIARLRDVDAYDKALIVVTADHGASYRDGQPRRVPREQNRSDILDVPLFIKLPGQQQGEVVDRIVETVDILPTILDVVAANVSLRLDGRSLIDRQTPARSFRTFVFRDHDSVSLRVLDDAAADRAPSLDRKLRRFGSGDPMALYAPAGAHHLLGTKGSPGGMPQGEEVQITIRDREQFAAVKLDRDPLPLYVRGVLRTSRRDPLTVAVAVNGTVAAVSQSYREGNAHVFGTLIPETVLRDGNNSVTGFVVDGLPLNAAVRLP